MKKKHIRTIIISAFALLVAITAIFRMEIEPVKQPSEELTASSPVIEAELPQEEVTEDEKETTEAGTEKNTESTKEEVKEEVTAETSEEETLPKETNQSKEALIPSDDETPAPKPDEHFCTIEIRCDTVVDTSKLENQAVAPYVPESGVILPATEFLVTPGESVFDILLRATKESGIHMEFRDDNAYSGKYIEGINYLYEMDGGPLSGWMYKVNGQFPNYGCASYEVKAGDAIVWMYTCDLGVDVGDNSTW